MRVFFCSTDCNSQIHVRCAVPVSVGILPSTSDVEVISTIRPLHLFFCFFLSYLALGYTRHFLNICHVRTFTNKCGLRVQRRQLPRERSAFVVSCCFQSCSLRLFDNSNLTNQVRSDKHLEQGRRFSPSSSGSKPCRNNFQSRTKASFLWPSAKYPM